MLARCHPVFEAVPGTHDVRVVLVEAEAEAIAAVIEALDDAVDQTSLAHRTALMRACVLVGVNRTPEPEEAYLKVLSDSDNVAATLGNVGAPSDDDRACRSW